MKVKWISWPGQTSAGQTGPWYLLNVQYWVILNIALEMISPIISYFWLSLIYYDYSSITTIYSSLLLSTSHTILLVLVHFHKQQAPYRHPIFSTYLHSHRGAAAMFSIPQFALVLNNFHFVVRCRSNNTNICTFVCEQNIVMCQVYSKSIRKLDWAHGPNRLLQWMLIFIKT